MRSFHILPLHAWAEEVANESYTSESVSVATLSFGLCRTAARKDLFFVDTTLDGNCLWSGLYNFLPLYWVLDEGSSKVPSWGIILLSCHWEYTLFGLFHYLKGLFYHCTSDSWLTFPCRYCSPTFFSMEDTAPYCFLFHSSCCKASILRCTSAYWSLSLDKGPYTLQVSSVFAFFNPMSADLMLGLS